MEGTVIPVLCYTNCDSAELFVNGRSFGEKGYEFPRQGMSQTYGYFDKPYQQVTTSDLHLSWDVPYESGLLKLVAKKDGIVVCEKEIATTGEAARVCLTPDRERIVADGNDVCHYTVSIVDADGNYVPDANHRIVFRVEGEGILIGTDNGQPDCKDDFQSPVKNTFNGLCIAIVQSTRHAGSIRVTAESEGLISDSKKIAAYII
jgi:beta-galactosidase